MAATGAAYERGAGPGPGARLRRGRPDRRRQRRRRGGEDGDPRPARLPHPGHARRGRLRGDRGDPARRPRLRQGARPLAEAARRRRAASTAGSASASSPASSTAATRWRRSSGPFNAVMVEAPAITEVTMSGPGRGRRRRPPRRCSATSSRSSPATRRSTRRASGCRWSRDVASSFYLHLEVADEPGVLARIAKVLGEQRDLGEERRPARHRRRRAPGDGRPRVPRVALRRGGRGDRPSSTSCAPRRASIRVIEEEFV